MLQRYTDMIWKGRKLSATGNFNSFPAITTAGTAVANGVPIASSGVQYAFPFTEYKTATTAGAVASFRTPTPSLRLNNNYENRLDFQYRFSFVFGATMPNARMFMGFRSSGAAWSNVDPSIQKNQFGIGFMQGSDDLHLFRGGSVAQAPVSVYSPNKYQWDVFDFCVSVSYGNVSWILVKNVDTLVAGDDILTMNTTVFPRDLALTPINSFISNNGTSGTASLIMHEVHIRETYTG